MSKFQVGQQVIRTKLQFNDFKEGQPYVVTKVYEQEDDYPYIEVEGFPKDTLWDEEYFELYQEPAQIAFNPKPGDTIVTEGRGTYDCIPQPPQDLSFQVKALELENQMLRMLLRREGVEV